MQIIRYAIAFCFLFSVLTASAQMHERGKKNVFLEPEASINFSNPKRSAFTGEKFGMSYGIAAGKIFMDFIKVGLVYRYSQSNIGTWDSVGINYTSLPRQYAGVKAELMFPFWTLSLGKSKKYECTVLRNYLCLGPEFGTNIGLNTSAFQMYTTEFLLNASWSILFKKSGSNKKQAANDIYFSINMKHGQTPFTKRSADSQKLYSTYWGASVIWVRYRTGNWLR